MWYLCRITRIKITMRSSPCGDDRTVNSFEHFNRRASISMPASWDTGDLAPDIPLNRVCNAHLTLASCYWSWWRSLPPTPTSAAVRPYVKARKFLHLTAQRVNVPKEVVEDLILQSQGAVLSNLNRLIISNGSVAIPRAFIQEMFEVIDACITGIPFVPSDSVDAQVRGLGSMVAFWERMRNICPKVNYIMVPSLRMGNSVSRLMTLIMQCWLLGNFGLKSLSLLTINGQTYLKCIAKGKNGPIKICFDKLGAIAGCHCWAPLLGCHCWVPLLGCLV